MDNFYELMAVIKELPQYHDRVDFRTRVALVEEMVEGLNEQEACCNCVADYCSDCEYKCKGNACGYVIKLNELVGDKHE